MRRRSGELRQAAEVQRLRSAELLRLGFVMALAMTLHNMPEGFAVRPSATRTPLPMPESKACTTVAEP